MARVAHEFLNWPDELSVRMSITNLESTFEYVLDAHTTIALGEIKPMLSTLSSPEANERR
jgi:hypothetical protein